MKIGKWPLIVAATVIVIGVGLVRRKRNKDRSPVKLQQVHSIDELKEDDAREVLGRLYLMDAESLGDYLSNLPVLLGVDTDIVTVPSRSEQSLGVDELVSRLEARANVYSTEEILASADKTNLLSTGFHSGRLALNVGQWWHKAFKEDGEPDMNELTELLAGDGTK